MSENSHIQWTNHTFNPWVGCTKVSPACANCYAETLMDTRYGRVKWGKGQPRSRTSAENWKLPHRWNRKGSAFGAPRQRVFCASLADWLDAEVPIEWLADLLNVIMDTPHLDWLLLTKRPLNWRPRLQQCLELNLLKYPGSGELWLDGTFLDNIWIGITAENQKYLDERFSDAGEIPAKVHFLSCEPLLGPLDLTPYLNNDSTRALPVSTSVASQPAAQSRLNMPPSGISWVIAGGESGTSARITHPDHFRALRDQCQAADVPFLFKQWGEWLPHGQFTPHPLLEKMKGEKLADGTLMLRPGVKRADNFLDGRQWMQFPNLTA